ncbi:hypothetical protein [Cupriavidus sp. a3]|uniref:hypothetical protein n=1 Tax=Cupriavidus sp. a3 TaxID=3242158 RepID=UPI003D9BFFB0
MGTVVQPMSLQEALRAAFLRGEKVIAHRFAVQHGFSRQGVSDGLKVMQKRGLLTCRELVPELPRKPPLEFTCIDMAGMQAFQPRQQNQNPMISRRRKPGPFSALLDVWGIGHADIRLPAIRHLMNDPEVSL